MDLMEVDDGFDPRRNFTMEGLIPSVDTQRRKAPSRRVSMCLGLLCAVLLAGNVGQLIYSFLFSHPTSADPMQAAYSTGSDQQLQARLKNLTTEKDQLQQSCTTLQKEKTELQTQFNSLRTNRDELQRGKDRLQTRFNSLQMETDQLQSNYSTLSAVKDQLEKQVNKVRGDMTKEKDALQQNYNNLEQQKDHLQTNFNNLQREKNELQTQFNTMRTNRDQLQGSYSSVKSDKDQLQTRFNSLQKEKDQLQNSYSTLSAVRDQLEKKVNKIKARPCETGWKKFDISCFFVSAVKKNWTVSRNYCLSKGADLAVIDSREKQVFINGLLATGVNAWIGLTDSGTEGDWMWVDGTPVTTTYWQAGQPNSYEGNQDCGEVVQTDQIGGWNDDGCFAENVGICEK
ncbi:uncharacterized protein LOC141793186 [Halichoeres trimaculatus]|uniref:uncharacterized protein LOC141793186 n=1 Tax=Halichoeres trimaculatus TaxID=147232 RepID=UPI003D9DF24F